VTTTIDAVAFARRLFTGAEVAWLEAAAPGDQPSRLCTLWTLKEALSKALGYGLGLPLTSTSFTVDSGRVALTVFPSFDDDVWHCATINLGSHVVSVVANAAAAAVPVDIVEVDVGVWTAAARRSP
jgi:phosphopantetheinyl transferase